MTKKTKSLEEWCMDEGKSVLLLEWDIEKNKANRFRARPSDVAYNAPQDAFWRGPCGHEWVSPVVARTIFNRTCPICDPKQKELPIGSKYGCITIIGGFDSYQHEMVPREIARLEQEKAEFLQGKRKPNSNANSADAFDRMMHDYKSRLFYKCQCKCGKIEYMDEFYFLEKKHRYCSGVDESIIISGESEYPILSECGLKTDQKKKRLTSYPRVYDASYHKDFLNTVHESLEVMECVNDHYEVLSLQGDKRRKDSGAYWIYKLYKCRCYLCGKEQEIVSSKFSINPPTAYGYRAYGGYYSEAFCNCHEISSFQWIVTKILTENKVPYRVEYSFPDLYGIRHVNLLRYDFAIFDSNGRIKCLIECQGEQHFGAVEKFGGAARFEEQKKNDERKRIYAAEHGIALYEIPYTDKKYEKVQDYLKAKGIISCGHL